MGFIAKIVSSVVSAVVSTVTKVVDTVVNTVKAVIADPLPTLAAIAGQAIGIPAPVTMAAITGARGGDLGDMAAAATIAYVAPQAASQVSAALAPTVSTAISNPAVASAVTNATSKALVNGTIAEATGGDFGEAAAGTMAGSLAASGYQNLVAPSVVAKAQEMGLSAETAKDVSAGLRTGIAAGTATAVSGGDFVAGFATAIAEEGIEAAQANAAQALKDAAKQTKTAFEESSGTGLTTALVDQVPVSPNAKAGTVANADGNAVGSIDPFNKEDAFKQVVAAFEEPTTPSKQIGLPTAALAGAFIPEDQTRTDQPKVSLPEINLKPTIVDQSDVNTLPKIEVVASPDEWEADQDLKDLKNLYKASTGKELLPSFATSTASAKQKVDEAKAALDAAVVASTAAPTPENVQKVEEAKANLDLNQKMYDSAVKEAGLAEPAHIVQPDILKPEPAVAGATTTFTSQLPPQPATETPIGGLTPEISKLYEASTGVVPVAPEPTSEQPSGGLSVLTPGGGLSVTQPGGVTDVGAEGVTPGEQPGVLPPVEVVGEPPIDEAALDEELADQIGGQQFPLTPPQQQYPAVTYNYFGSPEYQRRLRARRMRSPLAAVTGQEGALGDLGAGIVFLGDEPYQYLQPSLLARGGLIRLKKV